MDMYQTIIIIDPTYSMEVTQNVILDVKDTLEHYSGTKAATFEDWGVKKLAYPIGVHTSGHYAIFKHCATRRGCSSNITYIRYPLQRARHKTHHRMRAKPLRGTRFARQVCRMRANCSHEHHPRCIRDHIWLKIQKLN